MRRPCAVSCMLVTIVSPGFMNRSCVRLGVKVAAVESTGLAGACERPLFVMKAKLTYSGEPSTLFTHVGFCWVPLIGSCARLSMFSAAHHALASQLTPAGHDTQPGG